MGDEISEITATMQALDAAKENQKKLDDPATPEPAKKAIAAENASLDTTVDERMGRLAKSQGMQAAGAEYHLSRGSLDKAGSAAERAIGLAKPGGDRALAVKAWTIKGLVEFQKHDYVAAHTSARTALKGDPDFRPAFELMMYAESALHLRGMDALIAERTKRVMALTDRTVTHTPREWGAAQAQRPTEAGRLVRKVMEARRNGDAAAQAAFAEAAVKADPSDPMVYFQRGRVRTEQGDYNGAITDLTQAMVQGWTEPLLFKLRAEALLLAGRHLAAHQDALMAIAYDPKGATAYVLRAQSALLLHLERKDLAEHKTAIMADLKTALELEPRLANDETFKALTQQALAVIAEIRGESAAAAGAFSTGSGADAAKIGPGNRAAGGEPPAPWHERLTMKQGLAIGGSAFFLLALAGVVLGLRERQEQH
ncbi:MAG: hypothetical protein WC943_00740 [Elusimicrobiota bacterium]